MIYASSNDFLKTDYYELLVEYMEPCDESAENWPSSGQFCCGQGAASIRTMIQPQFRRAAPPES